MLMLLLLLLETLIQESCNDWQKMLIQERKPISISQVRLWGVVNLTRRILEKYFLKMHRDALWVYGNRWWSMTSLYVCGVDLQDLRWKSASYQNHIFQVVLL